MAPQPAGCAWTKPAFLRPNWNDGKRSSVIQEEPGYDHRTGTASEYTSLVALLGVTLEWLNRMAWRQRATKHRYTTRPQIGDAPSNSRGLARRQCTQHCHTADVLMKNLQRGTNSRGNSPPNRLDQTRTGHRPAWSDPPGSEIDAFLRIRAPGHQSTTAPMLMSS